MAAGGSAEAPWACPEPRAFFLHDRPRYRTVAPKQGQFMYRILGSVNCSTTTRGGNATILVPNRRKSLPYRCDRPSLDSRYTF